MNIGTMQPRGRRRGAAPALIGALGLVVTMLAGCATSADRGPEPTAGTSSSASAAPAPTETGAAAGATPIPKGDGVFTGLKLASCSTTPGRVTAAGTFTMPNGKAGDVVVSVSWVTVKGNTILAQGLTTLKGLSGKASKQWTVTAQLAANGDPIECVPGAVIPTK